MTTPGVDLMSSRGFRYAEIKCACLPDRHEQKWMEKLSRLEVIFPGEWRWGRRIEPLPVVRI